jgi:hypothetical protein
MASTTALPRCPLCGLEQDLAAPAICPRPSCGVELRPGSPERHKVRTFRLVGDYSLCVLPFTFTEQDGLPLPQRLTRLGRWRERTFSLDNQEDVDRTEYFLPYIRRFLFPSLFAKQTEDDKDVQKPTCWHFVFDLHNLGSTSKEGLPLRLVGHDTRKRLNVEQTLLLESIQMIVFGYRVGFLLFRFRGTEPDATFFDQMEALEYLRTIAPLYRGFQMPELVAGSARYHMRTLLPYLLAEFSPTDSAPAAPVGEGQPTTLSVKPTFDDRMMVYAFSCLDKETVLADPRRCQSLLERYSIIGFDPKDVSRPRGEFDPDQDAWVQARWQSFTKDGGMLVVFNTDRYHSQFMGVYFGTYYFDIFLLAALQRVTLLSLFDQFSDIQHLIAGSASSRKLLRRVRRDLLLFKNQCSFSQITNRARGLTLWKKWRKVFETRTLLREVNEQSEELNTYLQARYRERIEWLVRIGGFLAAAIPIIFGLDRFIGQHEWLPNLRWALLTLMIAGAAVVAYFFVFRQRDED